MNKLLILLMVLTVVSVSLIQPGFQGEVLAAPKRASETATKNEPAVVFCAESRNARVARAPRSLPLLSDDKKNILPDLMPA